MIRVAAAFSGIALLSGCLDYGALSNGSDGSPGRGDASSLTDASLDLVSSPDGETAVSGPCETLLLASTSFTCLGSSYARSSSGALSLATPANYTTGDTLVFAVRGTGSATQVPAGFQSDSTVGASTLFLYATVPISSPVDLVCNGACEGMMVAFRGSTITVREVVTATSTATHSNETPTSVSFPSAFVMLAARPPGSMPANWKDGTEMIRAAAALGVAVFDADVPTGTTQTIETDDIAGMSDYPLTYGVLRLSSQ